MESLRHEGNRRVEKYGVTQAPADHQMAERGPPGSLVHGCGRI